MLVGDLNVPRRLLACGGPSTPHPSVLRALTTPAVGQFDPDFTTIMDDVMTLARAAFATANPRSYAVSGLTMAGLEAMVNSLVQTGEQVAILGSAAYLAETAEIVRRSGGEVVTTLDDHTPWVIAAAIDPFTAEACDLRGLARDVHARGSWLIVDATLALCGRELRVDEWHLDACIAGVDACVGAPSGLALVTYSEEIEQRMHGRVQPPSTHYLDLLQLQAYWSPQRLNHHTAPTSLVYGLREALRLVLDEGLESCWERHSTIGRSLRAGLSALGLNVRGEPPYAVVQAPPGVDERRALERLREDFGVHVRSISGGGWRVGLVGADAQRENVLQVLAAMEQVLGRPSLAITAALAVLGV